MSVTHDDYRDFAQKLVRSKDEIDHRNAAGRAYYAAYHLSGTILDRCPNNDHLAMGSHERITERLRLQGSPLAKSLMYILTSMKSTRKTADYEIADPFPATEAENQLKLYAAYAIKVAEFGKNTPPLF
jgi:uncharacterized protein (UPF0332 family)